MPKWTRMVAVGALALFGLAACDSGGDFDEAAYCDIANELAEIDDVPTNEQLDRYVDASPDDIRSDAEFVADKFKEAEGNLGALFSDPQVAEEIDARIANLEAAETEHCGIEHDAQGEGDEDEGEGEGEDANDSDDTEPADGANVVEITGVEYAFEGVPAEVPAGLTALGFTNGGEEAHEMGVFKFAEGVTAEEALAFEGDPEEEGLVSEVGFVFGELDGDTAYVNSELDPGSYGMACFIPGPEGKSHAELGMFAEFTVA